MLGVKFEKPGIFNKTFGNSWNIDVLRLLQLLDANVPVVVPGPSQGQSVFGVALKQHVQDSSSEESHVEDACYDPRTDPLDCQQHHWSPQTDPRGFQSPHSGRNHCNSQTDLRGFQNQHSTINHCDLQRDHRGFPNQHSSREPSDIHTQLDSLRSSHVEVEQQQSHSLGSFSGLQAGQDINGVARSRLQADAPFRHVRQPEMPDDRRSIPMHGHFPSLSFTTKCYSQLTSRPPRPPQHGQRPIGISSFKSASSTSFKSPSAAPSAAPSAYPGIGVKRRNPFNYEKEDNNIADKKQRFQRTAEALRKSGLMEITMQSAKLLRQNKALQTEIDELKLDTIKFLRSVMNNPENRNLHRERKQ